MVKAGGGGYRGLKDVPCCLPLINFALLLLFLLCMTFTPKLPHRFVSVDVYR